MHQEENSHCNFGALCLYIGGCRANLGPSPGQMSTAVVGDDHVVIAVIINAMRQGFIVIEEAFQLLYLSSHPRLKQQKALPKVRGESLE
jgi:hypothetical protein